MLENKNKTDTPKFTIGELVNIGTILLEVLFLT